MSKLPFEKQVAMEVLFKGHGPTTFKGIVHNLSRSELPELMLEDAEMPGVILDGADLQKAWLKGSNLRGARLVLADLHEADLSEADLRNTLLVNTNLMNAILRGADLRGANLTQARLQGACLEGAIVDGADQLSFAASLYRAWGLSAEIETELANRSKTLFQKPTHTDDDPDYVFDRDPSYP